MDPEVQLLQTLVAIPSVNPMLADDPSIGGEARMAAFLADYLAGAGFAVESREELRDRPNIIGRRTPKQVRRTVLVEAHLDTQGIHGMTVDPFAGDIRDDRLYGRGACDMKGAMAAALTALDADTLNRLEEAGVELIFVGAIGEEKGNLGARQLAGEGLGANEALILEPTELEVVLAHKGACWFEVETLGRAAHGSNPDAGCSAVMGMYEVLAAMQKDVDESSIVNPVLGRPTMNVGILRGGSSINIVPERCVAEVDRRLVPGEDPDEVRESVREHIRRAVNAGTLVDGTVRPIEYGPPFETNPSSRLVRRLLAGIAEEGLAANSAGAGWYSDAGPFSLTCEEVAVFGPGSIHQAHTADEYIELSSLRTGTRILQRFFRHLADPSSEVF